MTNHNGGVPDLGALKRPPPTHASVAPAAFVRELDQNGVVPLVGGGLPRTAFLDASQLIEEMRRIVREELRAFAVRMRMSIPEDES